VSNPRGNASRTHRPRGLAFRREVAVVQIDRLEDDDCEDDEDDQQDSYDRHLPFPPLDVAVGEVDPVRLGVTLLAMRSRNCSVEWMVGAAERI
jgi:hypothetical protein